ncbi:MAG TPA: hypothetical protein VM493_08710 [Vicinamibacterales bacterium]|nr:hypothetical protein [Vicinamibacterales bacterium]
MTDPDLDLDAEAAAEGPIVDTSAQGVQPKVQAAGAAGAVTVLVVFIAGQLGLEIGPEVASAITTLVAVAAGYLKT